MNFKIAAYAHGKDENSISSINLIFLLDAKTIGTVEFKDDNFVIAVYGDNKEKKLEMMINNSLYRIFDGYPNIKLNEFGEYELNGKNFLPVVLRYVKNENVDFNFIELNKINERLFSKYNAIDSTYSRR